MLCANHPVADIINEGLEIVDELDLRIIKDDTKMWCTYYEKEWRRQELDKK